MTDDEAAKFWPVYDRYQKEINAIGAGIYLAEAGNSRTANTVRFVADVMNGIPSIVIGIFVWATVVLAMGRFSALAGGIALAVMLIPFVTRTTE
jgi:phosphate transport system permease protein